MWLDRPPVTAIRTNSPGGQRQVHRDRAGDHPQASTSRPRRSIVRCRSRSSNSSADCRMSSVSPLPLHQQRPRCHPRGSRLDHGDEGRAGWSQENDRHERSEIRPNAPAISRRQARTHHLRRGTRQRHRFRPSYPCRRRSRLGSLVFDERRRHHHLLLGAISVRTATPGDDEPRRDGRRYVNSRKTALIQRGVKSRSGDER